jgi:hypothetical protein
MEKLIGGTEAMRLLGISKKSNASSTLKRFGVEILMEKQTGKGRTVLVSEKQVEEIASKVKQQREQAQRVLIEKGKPTRFVPSISIIQKLDLMDQKIDRIMKLAECLEDLK